MGHDNKKHEVERTPIGLRDVTHGLGQTFLGLTRENLPGQLLAGVTLLAIAIPEQLATAQLAGVPAFTGMIAFIAATLVFSFVGSNPILSVGADSTIAPLFAVALVSIALPASSQYYALVAGTALISGVILTIIGLLRLGWLADFLSAPIVVGFLGGIGIIIIVHQLPRVFGVASGGDSIIQRLTSLGHYLHATNGWSLVIGLGTLGVMLLGEKVNPRLPWALAAVLVSSVLVGLFSLNAHGVQDLGTVVVGLPTWRLQWFSVHQWSVMTTTSLTLVVVIMSQSAASSRTSADEIGVADDLSRDFVGIGLANVATGMLGSFAVDASPARTTISRLAGGRTKMVGFTAAIGALVLSPLATFARDIPLSALAGVLLFIAGRLIKVAQMKQILHCSRPEFVLSALAGLGVVFLGVEKGLALAVGLAILEQTWRSARPRMVEMGRRRGSTSWEPYDAHAVERVDHILAVLFDQDLFFANANVFRRELHGLLKKYPQTKHVIIDAVAISDIDYTALAVLDEVVADLNADHISISLARANAALKEKLHRAGEKTLRLMELYDSVDAAAQSLK
ncbi:MAG: SulP family inorganic anion transporter [Acidimicrobiales bacterium]